MRALLTELVVSFLGFGVLAALWPCNRGQPRFLGRDQPHNLLYMLVGLALALLFGDLAALYIRTGAAVVAGAHADAVAAAIMAGYGRAARLPAAAQAGLVLLALDFVQYWLHRLFHSRPLWPFHAIHHSAEDLDWTATYRNHPVNFVIYNAGALALVHLAGFAPAAFAIVAGVNAVVGPLVHANLDWTFGPLRYVIASPVYHRWHHVKDPAIHNRNFAPTFPFLDLAFGTFHMPKGELPAGYGVEGAPATFTGQLLYPFRVIGARLSGRASLDAGERVA